MTVQAQASPEVELLRAQLREARQLARERDEFLAMVAHELRAPLAAILGWADMLRHSAGPEEFESGLAVIEESAQLQAKLIEDLLLMARMASDGISLALQLTDMRHVIDAAIDALRPLAAGKELRLHKSFDPAVGPVRGDPPRLQQVIGNLLANAVKFTAPRGLVEVTLSRSRGWAAITVADDGAGIAPAFLPHVFDRFKQDPSTAASHSGLGLGLAIARQLVELHGGEIEAHSEGAGRGATFVVRLPLADLRGPQALASQQFGNSGDQHCSA
jgi:signal transduction histidine kinase